MSKGLKDTVAEATEQQPEKPPVHISGEAIRAISNKARQWSGWPDAHVVFGEPTASPFAECDHSTHTFTLNPEELVLNPNRVLLTVTPFRLKQEAVLTGALLHEAGHARHSLWAPRNVEDAAKFRHSNGTEVTPQTMAFAKLLEEPRIEALQAQHAANIGADELGWTMRASAAHLLPMTKLAMEPNQQLMDMITSWVLRAGRQIALERRLPNNFTARKWVSDFNSVITDLIRKHLIENDCPAIFDAHQIINKMVEMMVCDDDRGTTMVDEAAEVLSVLFPETQAPTPNVSCQFGSPEAGSEGEGDSGDGAGESDESEGESGDGEGSPDEDSDEDSDDGEGDGEGDDKAKAEHAKLAAELAKMEQASKKATESEAKSEARSQPATDTSKGATDGGMGLEGGSWRSATKEEREVQKGAEGFLRELIAPSESSKTSLTDTPSSTVDGAALSAWKAGGQITSPNFFQRTRREIEPSPPVQIAILVDVSGSMGELQRPSAVLSWALSAAAMDLRNFAGRGQQIESCLIHWGSTARVIQHNGQPLPGMRTFACVEGTHAMGEALSLVDEEMPGFFDASEKPSNRLLVQFTDWELGRACQNGALPWVERALAAGVNMLSVVPGGYSLRRSDLAYMLSLCTVQRGASTLLRYNPMFPDQVWETAAQALT